MIRGRLRVARISRLLRVNGVASLLRLALKRGLRMALGPGLLRSAVRLRIPLWARLVGRVPMSGVRRRSIVLRMRAGGCGHWQPGLGRPRLASSAPGGVGRDRSRLGMRDWRVCGSDVRRKRQRPLRVRVLVLLGWGIGVSIVMLWLVPVGEVLQIEGSGHEENRKSQVKKMKRMVVLHLHRRLEETDDEDHQNDLADGALQIVERMNLEPVRSGGRGPARRIDLADKKLVNAHRENKQYRREEKAIDGRDERDRELLAPFVRMRERVLHELERGVENGHRPAHEHEDARRERTEHGKNDDEPRVEEEGLEGRFDPSAELFHDLSGVWEASRDQRYERSFEVGALAVARKSRSSAKPQGVRNRVGEGLEMSEMHALLASATM